MARKYKSRNPIGFTPWPVTVWTTLVLAALLSCLLAVHTIVPPAPKKDSPKPGINITTAWLDLQHLTDGFHPYNSHRNNEVRTWLLRRIDQILGANNATAMVAGKRGLNDRSKGDTAVKIYDDLDTNFVFSSRSGPMTVAFAAENIIVYIRGSEDEAGLWWEDEKTDAGHRSGVLVNAHFDSVPSGYGATDDGVGVVSVLQLISYFTTPGNQPKRGVVALLNNGEEDYLNGAYAFTQHPIAKFPHTFLNLEGAGAGGRAILFRSTDAEVTKFYERSPYPFGSVVSLDGFKRGLIRSDTDYSVFAPELGLRGLDVAFFEPRARYHTVDDSAKYTSRNSLWHMLSSAIATMDGLTSDLSDTFEGSQTVRGGVHAGRGSDSVFFDLFGRTFAVFQLHTLFAISVTLLVVTPVILIGLEVILRKTDKWYLFARKKEIGEEGSVQIRAFRGFFRFPVVWIVSTAAVVALGLLIAKINPYIIYSSEYSVWSTILTAWFSITWFLLKGADSTRPSALQRTYTLFWLYILTWLILVLITISENNLHLASGYSLIIYFSGVFLALLISYLELFALPKKQALAEKIIGDGAWDDAASSRPLTRDDERSSRQQSVDMLRQSEDDDANERTSLLRGDRNTTFAGGYGGTHGQRSTDEGAATDDDEHIPASIPQPYPKEQIWSGYLPSWTWLLQLLILTVVPLILIGQVGLLMTSSLYQTASDGSSALLVYLLIAGISTLFLTPLSPFIHRIVWLLPTILFLISVGTLIYNLTAFPFSSESRLKVYFLQQVDLDTGINTVSLTGLMPFTRDIAASIPSAAGQNIHCSSPDYAARSGLKKCSWAGIPPNPLDLADGIPPEKGYKSWVSVNATRLKNASDPYTGRLSIDAKNTRACRVFFENNVLDLNVTGYDSDPRFPRVYNESGTASLRLWRREWDKKSWEVVVRWDGGEVGGTASKGKGKDKGKGEGLDGKVVCLWSDVNQRGTVPAWDEVLRFGPAWSVPTKLSDGIVEGSKGFKV